jgi:hypothetical protein
MQGIAKDHKHYASFKAIYDAPYPSSVCLFRLVYMCTFFGFVGTKFGHNNSLKKNLDDLSKLSIRMQGNQILVGLRDPWKQPPIISLFAMHPSDG